jgi:hypothetical protein
MIEGGLFITKYNGGRDMRNNANDASRIQGSQPIPAKECLFAERNTRAPRIRDVFDKVILHDADGQNTIQFSWINWGQILDLGESNGWDPIGTNPPSLPPDAILDLAPPADLRWEAWEQEHQEAWSGTYFSCDYQEVVWDDACALAAALQSALPDLKGGRFKGKLKQFISFCQDSGGFTIGHSEGEHWPQEPLIQNDMKPSGAELTQGAVFYGDTVAKLQPLHIAKIPLGI